MKKIFAGLIIVFCLFPTINLAAQIAENTQSFIIENISIEGNSKTKRNVILENLSFSVGDTLSEEEIYSGVDRIRSLNIFKEISLQPRAGSEPGKILLIIKVKEKYWPYLQFKGGFSELSGWYITPVSLNMDNIFGYGNFINTDFTFGDRVTSLAFNCINPNIFDSDLDFYASFKIRNQQFINYIGEEKFIQQAPQGGLFLGLRSRRDFFKNFLFGWDFYVADPDSFFTNQKTNKKFYDLPPRIAQFSHDKFETSAFSIYFDLDKRDQFFYPTRGWWLGMWFTQADVQFSSEVNFTRFIIDIRKYQHLLNKTVIAARLKLGAISSDAPFYEKFYLGGPNSLRGYEDRSLSPVGGGDRLLQTGVELRFPITAKKYPKHFLTGVLFFDGGANILTGEKFDKDTFKMGYGFGLRFRLPFISLFRMDFAYPVNTEEGDGRVQFSIGHTF